MVVPSYVGWERVVAGKYAARYRDQETIVLAGAEYRKRWRKPPEQEMADLRQDSAASANVALEKYRQPANWWPMEHNIRGLNCYFGFLRASLRSSDFVSSSLSGLILYLIATRVSSAAL